MKRKDVIMMAGLYHVPAYRRGKNVRLKLPDGSEVEIIPRHEADFRLMKTLRDIEKQYGRREDIPMAPEEEIE